MKNDKTNYGNWVPERLLKLLWSGAVIFSILLIVNLIVWKNTILTIIFSLGIFFLLLYGCLMQSMHHAFSFSGGGLMGKVHEYLLGRLDWDGKGSLIDIGCGSGALSIRSAKKYPDSKVLGVDYWGIIWDYAKEQCENNARIENINNIEFKKDDAAHLSFADESFDAAVSNFVFHEVRTVIDKRKLVIEALRIVKKGGTFAFHDLFEAKGMYGDINKFIEELKAAGISEINYEPHTENLSFVPKYIKPMFKNMGILYGKK